MVTHNAITGLLRKERRSKLPRKKRSAHASTPHARLSSKRALEAYEIYMAGMRQQLAYFCAFAAINDPIAGLCFMAAGYLFSKATRMLALDSELMDAPEETTEDPESHGHNKTLVDITIDTYSNDDEAEDKTRFTKQQLHDTLDDSDDLGEYVRIYYYPPKYYKSKVETLLLYALRKFSTGRTHKEMTEEFGGASCRWGRGYKWFVLYLDERYASLIGPAALEIWIQCLPQFAECIREFIVRPKVRERTDGTQYILDMPTHYLEPGDFNVAGFLDATHCEFCRPGAGPANNEDNAPRRVGWYYKQRAWYSGYLRGLEACCKLLTLLFPNGMSIVYGPTSGRRNDLTVFRWSEFDDHLMELCTEHHGGDLYCVYGDGIFAGNWYCLRTKHAAPPGMEPTPAQVDENDNLAAARISVEWSYARAEQLWPLLLRKSNYKVDGDPDKAFAEIRVMCLLTNFKVCCSEGSTMTGERMFQCPPPSLQECLNMRPNN